MPRELGLVPGVTVWGRVHAWALLWMHVLEFAKS